MGLLKGSTMASHRKADGVFGPAASKSKDWLSQKEVRPSLLVPSALLE